MGKPTPARGDSQLGVVILGSKSAPKHLVGNVILGREAFDTADSGFDCESRAGGVLERDVTLVKAPGWLRGYNLCDWPELVRTETILSVTLCPQPPHGFLLAINAEQSFRRVHRKATVQHLEHCFGEKVWSHAVVVFCRSGLPGESIQEYIRREGPPLQSLLEACGNRYHELCVDAADHVAGVRELFGKIDAMVAQNGCYEVEKALVHSVGYQRKGVEAKAEELRRRSLQQRQTLGKLLSEPKPHLRILMLGWVFSGKTATGNTILSDQAFQAGDRTVNVFKRSGTVAGREVAIVDTPGWWKFFPAAFTLTSVRSEILSGVTLCQPAPNVVLLVVPLDTSFTEEQRRVTEDNMRLFGPGVWPHAILLFTCGDVLGRKTIEQHIESEGKPLRWLVQKCGGRYHVIDNRSRESAQVTELLEKMEEMIAGNSCFYMREERDAQAEGDRAAALDEGIEEGGAKEIAEQLNIEWNRANWELYDTWKCDKSIELPISFKEAPQEPGPPPEDKGETVHQKEEDHVSVRRGDSPEVESEDDTCSGYRKNMKVLLEREWTRREASTEIYYERCADKKVISESHTGAVQTSRYKVLTWLENQRFLKTDKDNKHGKMKSVPQPAAKQGRAKRRRRKTKSYH